MHNWAKGIYEEVCVYCLKCFYCPAYLLDSEKSPYNFSFSRMLTESHAKLL